MPLFDKKDKSRYATFTRRSVGLGAGMSAVFAVLAGRLYQLQIRDGDQYMVEAEDNRVSERLIAPPRGRIMDRFGVELANSRRNYRIMLVSEQASEGVEAALDTIGKVVVITDQQKKKVMHDLAVNKKFVPVVVAENLSWEDFSRVNLHLPYLPGVQCDVGETRDYPFGPELVHVLGYVASVSPEEKQKDNDPLMSLPDMRIGKRGIEKEFEKEIRGRAGASRVEVNAYGRIIRELGKDPGQPGEDVYLTLDREVQQLAAAKLGSESAAVVVMDVHNGDVIALASTPGFDPNWFNMGLSGAQWRELTTNDHKPLLNKVMGGTYPPGSTFKTAVALAAVEAGIATPDYHVTCGGVYNFGGHAFHCWKKTGHGTLNVEGAIQHSCDVFFYETSRRLGIDKIEAAARKLGLGAPTGIELPGERSALVPSRAWKQKTYKWAWQQGDTLSVGIGQGYKPVTPLQLLQQAARLASGKAVSPRLVHSVGGQETVIPRPEAPPLDVDPKALAVVRDGMFRVMNVPGGTGFSWRIQQPGFEIAGKTGTAQVRVYTREEHARGLTKNEHLDWKMRDHALFIGYAPAHDPKYAIVSIIEHGAVPAHPHVSTASEVMLLCQQRDPSRMPNAYPMNSAAVTAPDRRAAAEPVPPAPVPVKVGGFMVARPYAAAKRTLSTVDKLAEVNWGLVLLIVLIGSAGIAMLYSVAGGHLHPWALRQIGHFTLGLIVLLAAAMIDVRVWMSLAYPAYGFALLLLMAVDVVGHSGLGAERWISVGPMELQPSELMKISLVLALARFLHGKSTEEVSKPLPLAIGIAMIALPAVFVVLQPNLGTTLIIVMDGCALLFLAGLSWWWIAPTLAAAAAAVPLAWRFVLHDYQKARVETFLDPASDALGKGWNITQAKIAIGSGGVSGKGFLQGTQSRLNFLPEKQTDFIWTSFCEEFGFVGALALLILFAVVIFYGVQTAMSARSQFARLLAMGVILNFFFYIMVNGLMVMGLIPVVGIPMPLLSYGGSAMLTVMFGFGLLMSVHIHRQVEIPRHSGGII